MSIREQVLELVNTLDWEASNNAENLYGEACENYAQELADIVEEGGDKVARLLRPHLLHLKDEQRRLRKLAQTDHLQANRLIVHKLQEVLG